MTTRDFAAVVAALPKAELHLHLEGAIQPATVVELAARHGSTVTLADAAARYDYADFNGFLDSFRWVTSFLRTPADYALVTERMADQLLRQNVVYAEVIVAVGIMHLRQLDADAIFAAITAAGRKARERGLRLQWLPDGTWQFGPEAAMEVAKFAARFKSEGVVGFGMGGDELALPFDQFTRAYEYAAAQGLHRTAHAGEVGSPTQIMHAIEPLLAERIGHGLAVCRDAGVLEWLGAWKIPLEVCPTSNLRTGALARQLSLPKPGIEKHPLKSFFDRGALIALSTDDPAMFGTTLVDEYALCRRLGFDLEQTLRLMEMSFEAAFLPAEDKRAYLSAFDAKKKELGLV